MGAGKDRASGRATHERNPQAVSAVPVGIPDAEEIARVVAWLAKAATQLAVQAGVGGMETAGGFVSFLAANPEKIPLIVQGYFSDLPPRFHVEGCLSWHGMDGKIHWPDEIRKMGGRYEH